MPAIPGQSSQEVKEFNLDNPTCIYDISLALDRNTPAYPGDLRFLRTVALSFDQGDDCELSSLALSAHCGTHLDLPAHFITGGKRIGDYPPERFMVPAQVAVVDDPHRIDTAAVAAGGFEPGRALLFKTRNSAERILSAREFQSDYVYLTAAGARACAALEPPLVGIDALSIDPPDAPDFPAHRELLGRGIIILEGIDLALVPPGNYTLLALPLKIGGGEASPVRAVLLGRGAGQ